MFIKLGTILLKFNHSLYFGGGATLNVGYCLILGYTGMQLGSEAARRLRCEVVRQLRRDAAKSNCHSELDSESNNVNQTLSRISKFTLFIKKFNPLQMREGVTCCYSE